MPRRKPPQPPNLAYFVRPESMPVSTLLDVGREYLRSMGMLYEADTVLGEDVEARDVDVVVGRLWAVQHAYEAAGLRAWASHAMAAIETLQATWRRLEDAQRLEAI
jgi:hypothetical protein